MKKNDDVLDGFQPVELRIFHDVPGGEPISVVHRTLARKTGGNDSGKGPPDEEEEAEQRKRTRRRAKKRDDDDDGEGADDDAGDGDDDDGADDGDTRSAPGRRRSRPRDAMRAASNGADARRVIMERAIALGQVTVGKMLSDAVELGNMTAKSALAALELTTPPQRPMRDPLAARMARENIPLVGADSGVVARSPSERALRATQEVRPGSVRPDERDTSPRRHH